MMPDPAAIPVTTGFTWTAAGAWGTFIALLGVIIRQVGPWRKQRDEAEEKLRNTVLKRVEKLERTLDRERAKHDAERALDRHKIRNLVQCLDAVLFGLETNSPERTAEIVARVRAMRERQIAEETSEAAVIRAADMVAAARDGAATDENP